MNWKTSQVLNIKPLHNAPSRDAAYASEGPHPAGQDTLVWDLCCLTDLCELSGGFYIVIHESCDTQGILSVPMLIISQRYIARGPMLIVFHQPWSASDRSCAYSIDGWVCSKNIPGTCIAVSMIGSNTTIDCSNRLWRICEYICKLKFPMVCTSTAGLVSSITDVMHNSELVHLKKA